MMNSEPQEVLRSERLLSLDVLRGCDGMIRPATNEGLIPGDSQGSHNRHFWAYHSGTVNFAVADGSVQAPGYDIDIYLFQAMSTRNNSGVGEDRLIDEPPITFGL